MLPWILGARGIGLPLLLQPTNTSSLDGIEGASLPDATTLSVVVRNVVASLSTAILTNILQQRTRVYVAHLGRGAVQKVAQSGGSTGTATHLPKAIVAAQAMAYHDVFLITAAILVPALILGQFLRWSKGSKPERPERQGHDLAFEPPQEGRARRAAR